MSEEKKKDVAADPSLNDRLMKTRSIMLTGEISKESADVVIRNLLVMDSESSDPITVYINSPGGDVDAGFAIFDTVRFISSPVTMVGMGLVASAAVIVLLAVPAERRIGLPHSSYLIHQPMASMKGVGINKPCMLGLLSSGCPSNLLIKEWQLRASLVIYITRFQIKFPSKTKKTDFCVKGRKM